MYNVRLNTCNLEKLDDKFDLRAQIVKSNWNNVTKNFLEKGSQVKFKFWSENPDSSIQQVLAIAEAPHFETDSDGLQVVTIDISSEIKELLLIESEESQSITPFFHFDILDAKSESLFSSQDHGDNTLFYLSKEERAALVQMGLLYEELEIAQWLE